VKGQKCTFSSTGVKSTAYPYCHLCQTGFQLSDIYKLSSDNFCTLYHRKLSILSCRIVITSSSILLLTSLQDVRKEIMSTLHFYTGFQNMVDHGTTILHYGDHVLTYTHIKSSSACHLYINKFKLNQTNLTQHNVN